jgi:outer membrane protein OmpA-like peptidoglycan-associated protein
MTTTEAQTIGTPVQAAPRRVVEDAWVSLNRRYAIGAAALAAALGLLWITGNGPGAWRAAAPDAMPDVGAVPAKVMATATVTAGTPAAGPAASLPAPSAANAGAGNAVPSQDSATNDTAASGNGRPSIDPAALPKAVPGAPVARLYFEPDQAWPTGELGPRLALVLARLKAEPGTKALVSGFHDRRGSAERNAALAQRRAQAVRRVLIREGIAVDRIVLAKPQQTQGSGADREARRVEVTVAR